MGIKQKVRELTSEYWVVVLIYTIISFSVILYLRRGSMEFDAKMIFFIIYAIPLYAFLLLCFSILPTCLIGAVAPKISERAFLHIVMIFSSCGLIGMMGMLG